MLAVFDTNIIIDALNGIQAADEEYLRYEHVLISLITWMEVLVGAVEDDAQVRDFLKGHFEVIPLDINIAEAAVQLKRAHHIRLPDAIIWATAQTRNAVLVSRNTKDFSPDLEGIRVPYIL